MHLNGLDLKTLSAGNINLYATVSNSDNYTSLCSSIFNIEEVISYGLNQVAACAVTSDCTQGHPQATCESNSCVLPPGSETSESSWCSTGTATLGICDEPPSPVSGIEMHNSVAAGGPSAIIEVNANNISAFDISLYSDDNCSSLVDQFSAPGGETSYVARIDNIPEGENSLYYKYSQNGYTSSCTSTQANYKVFGETDLLQEYHNNNFSITATQSSTHGSQTADMAIDIYPAHIDHVPGGSGVTSNAHTGVDDESPWWQISFLKMKFPSHI